jgi:4,5-DOPA dioxygenase extradiol
MPESNLMPLLFVGHGSPMNAIEENEFTAGWKEMALTIPKPEAILCISAHWETNGTLVTAMEKPKTIHDFGGFPEELYQVQYPAPGHPELANRIKSLVRSASVGLDHHWGLDHGCWLVLTKMYPNAGIPVVQLSLDRTEPGKFHFDLGKELKDLRKQGILIIGSGNIVHNLARIDWNHPDKGYDWAVEANEAFKKMILEEKYEQLCDLPASPSAYRQSIPTPEHFLPLLYILGIKGKDDKPVFFNDKTIMGSLSMTSIKFG